MALEADVDVVEAGEMMIVRAVPVLKGIKSEKELALRWRVSRVCACMCVDGWMDEWVY